MKKLSLGLLLGVMLVIGMFAASVENGVSGEPAVPEAEAYYMGSIGGGSCEGGVSPVCYRPQCDGDKCPSEDQCVGKLICRLTKVANGGSSCRLDGDCDSESQGGSSIGSFIY